MSTTPEAFAEVVALAIKTAIAPLTERVQGLERDLTHARAALDDVGAMRERIAVLETRAPVPGPAGAPGRDGIDGIGVDDLAVEHDGERAFTFKGTKDSRTREFGRFTVPLVLYRGVWQSGRAYVCGDAVTYGGSLWHCQKDTSTQPDTNAGAPFWRLAVKRGERGRDAGAAVAVRS